MSVLFFNSVKNVNSNYKKPNVFGFLTLIFIINILPIIFYTKRYIWITFLLYFIAMCVMVTAQHNAIHEEKTVFPGFTYIFNNITTFLKNGFFMLCGIIFQYILFLCLFLAANCFIVNSLGFTGTFQEIVTSSMEYLHATANSGNFSFFLKELTLILLIALFLLCLFIGNYANFFNDLKFTSIFNFKRGFKFLSIAKWDTVELLLKSFVFYIILIVTLYIFAFLASMTVGIVMIFLANGARPDFDSTSYHLISIIFHLIVTYLFGYLSLYNFDLFAQYIRTNKQKEEEEHTLLTEE